MKKGKNKQTLLNILGKIRNEIKNMGSIRKTSEGETKEFYSEAIAEYKRDEEIIQAEILERFKIIA